MHKDCDQEKSQHQKGLESEARQGRKGCNAANGDVVQVKAQQICKSQPTVQGFQPIDLHLIDHTEELNCCKQLTDCKSYNQQVAGLPGFDTFLHKDPVQQYNRTYNQRSGDTQDGIVPTNARYALDRFNTAD